MTRLPSHGSRRETTWAVAQKPKPMPRIVRLGRPANDNVRQGWRLPLRLAGAVLAAIVLGLVFYAGR